MFLIMLTENKTKLGQHSPKDKNIHTVSNGGCKSHKGGKRGQSKIVGLIVMLEYFNLA